MTDYRQGYREYPELVCVLCGLIVEMYTDEDGAGGSIHSYPGQCSANGNGKHISPDSPSAVRARELHAAWLRNPHEAPAR